jgi:hypothetical protein
MPLFWLVHEIDGGRAVVIRKLGKRHPNKRPGGSLYGSSPPAHRDRPALVPGQPVFQTKM